jgi:ABC-type antimicrobial peptide transport system permease subunit
MVRRPTHLLEAFTLGALLLSAVGVFGVTSYTVTCRTREIGVRKALGAAPHALMRWVVVQAGSLTILGIVFGLAMAAMFSRVLQHLLFETSAFDPFTFVLAVGVLSVIGVLAAIVPGGRAASVDPVSVLGD